MPNLNITLLEWGKRVLLTSGNKPYVFAKRATTPTKMFVKRAYAIYCNMEFM